MLVEDVVLEVLDVLLVVDVLDEVLELIQPVRFPTTTEDFSFDSGSKPI